MNMIFLWLCIALLSCFLAQAQAQGQAHDFTWAMQSQDMRDAIFSFFHEDDWKMQIRLSQINQAMLELFARETDISQERWEQLGALYDHFGALQGWHYYYSWFASSNPCEWQEITCDEQGNLQLKINIEGSKELQASTAVIHALNSVARLELNFLRNFADLDLDYIARLFPKLEELVIDCNQNVDSFANLKSLSKIALKKLSIFQIGKPIPMSEWLPDMTHLEKLELIGLHLEEGQTELDLRQLIPARLAKFKIELPHGEYSDQHVRVLLSDDLIVAREQADGSVLHPLELNFKPEQSFPEFEMECSTLDAEDRQYDTRLEALTFADRYYASAPNIQWRQA